MKVVLFYSSKQGLQYNVKIETYNENANVVNNTLTYNCSVQQKRETLRGFVVNFRRSDVLLNNTKIHDSMNEITLILGELIHDLDLEITDYGKILKISNFKDIQNKWQKIKFNIEYTYLGDIVGVIIEELEKNVSNEESFIKSLYNDPFFCNFLYNIYGDYPNSRSEYEDEISNFAGINSLSIEKTATVEDTENKQRIVRGKAILSQDTISMLREKKGVQNIDFSLAVVHQLSSSKHMEEIELEQKLIVEGKLSARLTMNVKQIKS